MQNLTIAGTCGKDAELRTTQGGDQVASFSVAVDNGKDQNGNRRDSTWVDCSLWGKRAQSLAPYIKKGGKVTVSGRPTVRAHDGKAYLGVSVDQITLQGGNQQSSDSGQQSYQAPPSQGSAMEDDFIPFAPEWRI